ncbi:unnamed protein product [Oncorhynchus mykiss]|uniref:Exocyst complex component Sec3 PIP2-binding N-terminal domain-containing protein n=1 Tax=Oncorhynchus mykiss TaxID=8022 RepID=A0A060ZD85_ONCMY|nr:unnamed protein product [Oncorhynchus mykiss]
MWTIDQLRQVNGCDPNRDCPEFDLAFDNAFDQWVAGSAGEKCTFIQILHHTCQRYSSQSKPEFVNCQPKLLGGKRHSDKTSLSRALSHFRYLYESCSHSKVCGPVFRLLKRTTCILRHSTGKYFILYVENVQFSFI